MKKAFFYSLSVLIALLLVLSSVTPASAASTIYVRQLGHDTLCNGTANVDYSASVAPNCAYATIQNAISSASAGDEIKVYSGNYPITSTLSINKAVLLKGHGPTRPKLDTAGTAYAISITAAASFEFFEIEKTDDNVSQNLILINSHNVTIKNNKIHAKYVMGDAEVTRAMEIAGGLTGLLIEGNEIFAVRQPAYINPNTSGTIKDNYVYQTRGWVIDGAKMTFLNNLWGQGAQANILDIALLQGAAGTPADYYTFYNIVQVSEYNNDAVIEDQRVSPAVLSVVYVDDNATSGGNGGRYAPYKEIIPAIDRVVQGGKIYIAAGIYQDSKGEWRDLEIFKSLRMIGAGSGQTIVKLSGLQNGVEIRPDSTGIYTGTVSIQGMTFTKKEGNTKSADFAIRVGETGGTFNNLTFKDVEVAWAEARNVFLDNSSSVYRNVTIENCNFHDSGAWGFSARGTIGNMTIKNSSFNDNGWKDTTHGIGFDLDDPFRVNNLTVENSVFNNNTSKGINLVNITIPDLSKTNTAIFTNIQANNNGEFGVSLWEFKNRSRNLKFINPEIKYNGKDGFLIGVEGEKVVDGVEILNGILTANGRHGLLVYNYELSPGTIQNIKINRSYLAGNTQKGVATNTTQVVNASGNWWGSADKNAVQTSHLGNVDYTPWLNVGTDTSTDPGFQGDFSTLWVDDDSPQTGAKGYLQEGVDLVTSSGTLKVHNGTYSSSTIIINKPVTVEGQGTEVVINTGVSGGYGLDVSSNGFNLKGVTVQAQSGTLYTVKISGADNINVENVKITGAVRSGLDLIGCQNATLKNINSYSNGGAGIAISNSSNVTLENITTSNNLWGGIGLFTNKNYYTGNLSDGKTGLENITLTGTNSFSELNPLYLDYADPAHVIRNFFQSEFDYIVRSTATSRYVYYQKTKESALALINALDAATTPPGLFKPTAAIQKILDGSFHVLSHASGSMKIQPAVQLGVAHNQIFIYEGVFTDTITIDKPVELIGVGSEDNPSQNSILRKSTNAAIISVTASGNQSQPILLKNLRLEPVGVYGINISGSTIEHLKLENVKVVGAGGTNNSEVGIKVASATTLKHLRVENSSFENLFHGWYFSKENLSTNESTVEDVTVIGSSFLNNLWRGIYVEKLSGATFTNVLVQGNGNNNLHSGNGGVDINLKKGNYKDLIFNNLVVKDNGIGAKDGAGLMIKARDDGSYASYPASLDNVQVIGGVFEGNERGIRFGEPLKNNAGPTNAVIRNAIIRNNNKTYSGTDGSAYGGVINYTQQEVKAEENYWGTLSWAGYGTVKGIKDLVYGNVDWKPWSNETFTENYDIPTITYADDDNAGKSEGENGANGGIVGYNAFATIQDALKHVAPEGTVNVGAGNYTEDVIISKAVSLVGENRPILTGRFWVDSNDVSIRGFEVRNGLASTGVDQSAIYVSGGIANVTIEDNHILGTWSGGGTGSGTRGILTSSNVNNLLVDGNLIQGWVSGIYLNPTNGAITVRNNEIKNNWAGAGTDGQGNVLFKNNYFIGNIEGIGASTVGTSFIVEENAFINNTDALNWYDGKPISAKLNWWNGNKGPLAPSNPKGNGQPISSSIEYRPWLCDGTDTQPNVIGFQPAADAAKCTNLATKLVFTQYPSSAFENIPFAQQPAVRAEDDEGNLAITFDNFVFIDIANNPVGGLLLPGPYYKKAVDGVATFSGLYLNKAGQGYTLKAFGLGSSGDFILTEGAAFNVLKQQADLSVAVTDSPDPVNAGDALSYTVTVTNGGPHNAQGVSVSFQLPAGYIYQSASGSGWSCSQSGGVVTCTRAALPSGQSASFTVQGTAPTQAGSITATVTVTLSETMDDPNSANNQASATTTVVELPPTGPSHFIYLPLVLNNAAP